jgi:hypothetical protein
MAFGFGLSVFAAPAQAQSLSDALNAALANNCAALIGSTPRIQDLYLFDDGSVPPTVAYYADVNPANGLPPSTPPTATFPAPRAVTDGFGRVFEVRRTTLDDQQLADILAADETALTNLFLQNGVERLLISRFQPGAFGPGLSGICQTISLSNLGNGNSSSSGGVSGGSSSASGRSVSSLSSARDQSAENKKRKKKRKEGRSSTDDGYIRLASADGGLGLIGDAAGEGPFGVETMIDLRGGWSKLKRDQTSLENGFDGRSLWGQLAVTAELSDALSVAGSFGYTASRGEFNGVNSAGEANLFKEKSYTGGLYLLNSTPIPGEGELNLAVGAFYGGGDGSVERTFATTRTSNYFIDIIQPGGGVNTLPFVRTGPVSDDLLGEYNTRNYGFSAAASVSAPLGAFTLTPGVEFTYFNFRQSDYDEEARDAFNNGLALVYSDFKDEWTETRIGAALSRGFCLFGRRVTWEAYGDLVLTGGADTPTRTARFAEDLRVAPYVLSYEVDDLDKAFGRFGLAGALALKDDLEVFIGGETTAGHDYLTVRTVFAGIRFTP